MSEITGVIAKIKMTEQAKSKMYQEIGKELLTDYLFIQKAFKNQRAYYTEMDKIAEIRGGDNPMSMNDYMEATNLLNKKYLSEGTSSYAEDLLFIRYDQETQSLFYFHMFRWNATENLETSISLQTFLKNIAKYKDIDSKDFLFFSDCATDLLNSQFYKIWSVHQNRIDDLQLNAWDKNWDNSLTEINQLAKKYYFDIVDKYMTFNEEEGYWSCDEESLDEALKESFLDKELININ